MAPRNPSTTRPRGRRQAGTTRTTAAADRVSVSKSGVSKPPRRSNRLRKDASCVEEYIEDDVYSIDPLNLPFKNDLQLRKESMSQRKSGAIYEQLDSIPDHEEIMSLDEGAIDPLPDDEHLAIEDRVGSNMELESNSDRGAGSSEKVDKPAEPEAHDVQHYEPKDYQIVVTSQQVKQVSKTQEQSLDIATKVVEAIHVPRMLVKLPVSKVIKSNSRRRSLLSHCKEWLARWTLSAVSTFLSPVGIVTHDENRVRLLEEEISHLRMENMVYQTAILKMAGVNDGRYAM